MEKVVQELAGEREYFASADMTSRARPRPCVHLSVIGTSAAAADEESFRGGGDVDDVFSLIDNRLK